MSSSAALVAAAEVKPPEEGNVRVVSITTTSAATAIDAGFYGRQITFQAQTEDVFIVFGDSAAEADNTATSGDTRCAVIPSGQERSYFLRRNSDITHFAAETASGTATLRYFIS